eukprot:5146012-Pleurochrysis_carterae.AAC.2
MSSTGLARSSRPPSRNFSTASCMLPVPYPYAPLPLPLIPSCFSNHLFPCGTHCLARSSVPRRIPLLPSGLRRRDGRLAQPRPRGALGPLRRRRGRAEQARAAQLHPGRAALLLARAQPARARRRRLQLHGLAREVEARAASKGAHADATSKWHETHGARCGARERGAFATERRMERSASESGGA